MQKYINKNINTDIDNNILENKICSLVDGNLKYKYNLFILIILNNIC